MRALGTILTLAVPRWKILLAGIVISVAALVAGIALMGLAGGTVAAGMVGGAIGIVWMRGFAVGRVLLRYLERLVTHAATFRVLADIRVWFFRRVAASGAGGLGYRRAGDMLGRLVTDIEALDGLYLRVIVPLAGAFALALILARAIGHYDLWLVAMLVPLFTVAAFLLPWFALQDGRKAGEEAAAAAGRLRTAIVDVTAARADIAAVGGEGRAIAQVQAREVGLLAAQRRIAWRAALWGAAAFLCAQAALLLILVSALWVPLSGLIAAFLAVAAFEAISGLPRAGVQAGQAVAAAERVVETASTPAAVADPPVPAAPPDAASLRFEGVRFGWQAARAPFLDGFSLDVPAGARVALLGPSGAGKSSVAALALKLAQPSGGRILLGGTDIADLAAADVRARVAYLAQATHLFDDTIRANLRLSAPDATDDALWHALEVAQLADTVRGLPDRLDTWIGEGGARLSGGQGRRLALARTLLAPARIWILDEPAAGLDLATEREFHAALANAAEGRTLLLIAHRLTGAEKLDRVWRLSGGHAVPAAA